VENGIAVFRGIPYAEPPVGELRFRPPIARQRWTGVFDATHFGPTVTQLYVFDSDAQVGAAANPAGDDCLNLNVWTPSPGPTRLPVMVWIHGGAFKTGAGSDAYADGATFARDGVVTVTINYRLHALGFLYLDDKPGSGGFGLLDQIAALRWVRNNIAAFGGDPENVTIAGESAGGMSVGLLLGAPAARGLFRRAIMQSGAAQASVAVDGARVQSDELFAVLGLNREAPDALDSLDTKTLVDAAGVVARAAPTLLAARGLRPEPYGIALSGGCFPFHPVRGSQVLPDRPIVPIIAGAARHVDILIGTNADECNAHAVWMRMPELFSREAGSRLAETVFALIGRSGAHVFDAYRRRRQGMAEQDVTTAIMTDVMFRLPAIELAEAAQRHNLRTFMYRLAFKSAIPGFGAGHVIDVPFMWNKLDDPAARAMIGSSPGAQDLARVMHGAWVNFMKTGSPQHADLPDWPAYEPTRRATMQLDVESGVIEDPDGADRRLWDGVRLD